MGLAVKYTLLWVLFVSLFGGFSYYSHSKMHEGIRDAQLTVLMGDVNSTYDGLKILEVFPDSRQDYGFNQFINRGTAALASDGTRVLVRKNTDSCLIMNVTRSAAIRETNGKISCTPAMVAVLGSGKVLGRYETTYNGKPAYVAGRVITRKEPKLANRAYVLLSLRPVKSAHAEAQALLQGLVFAFFAIAVFSGAGFIYLYKTQQKQRRTAIENKLTLESVPSGVIRINEKQEILYVNPAMHRMFGYEPGDMIGQNVHMIIPEDYRDRHDKGFTKILSGGATTVMGKQTRASVHGLKSNRSLFPCSLTIDEVPVGGPVREFAGVFIDQTAEQENTRKIQRRNDQLASMAKMSRHDVLNNIGVAKTALDLIELIGHDDEVFKRAQNEIDAAIELLKAGSKWVRLIESGEGELTKETVSLNDLVEKIRPEGAKFVVDELGEITCNVGLMQSVLKNLFENSIRHSKENPAIYVEREYNTIKVIDNAGGFACLDGEYSEEYARRLMQPGQRGSEDVPGTGMGLASCVVILDAHGFGFRHLSVCGQSTCWMIDM